MKVRFYPDKVTVNKAKYALEFVPFIEERKERGGIIYTRGYCETKQKLITLLSEQSEADLFKTFLHEALHAIEAEYKVKIPHKLVYALEGPLADFIQNNFHIIPRR